MKTYNYYDFGAMEVNPPAHRRTDFGFNGTQLRCPKRGDKKNWKILLLYAFANFRKDAMDALRPIMGQYNITDADIEKEQMNTKNRVIRHKADASRRSKKAPSRLSEALREISEIDRLPSLINCLVTNGQKSEAQKNQTRFKKLTDPRKIKRRMEIINEWKNPHSYDEFLLHDLKKRGLLK